MEYYYRLQALLYHSGDQNVITAWVFCIISSGRHVNSSFHFPVTEEEKLRHFAFLLYDSFLSSSCFEALLPYCKKKKKKVEDLDVLCTWCVDSHDWTTEMWSPTHRIHTLDCGLLVLLKLSFCLLRCLLCKGNHSTFSLLPVIHLIQLFLIYVLGSDNGNHVFLLFSHCLCFGTFHAQFTEVTRGSSVKTKFCAGKCWIRGHTQLSLDNGQTAPKQTPNTVLTIYLKCRSHMCSLNLFLFKWLYVLALHSQSS